MLDTAYAFLTRYDFGKFGLRTAQGFNGLLDRFDADGLGRTLAAGFNAVFDFGYQAVSNFQWRKCGTKLGTSVNSFIQNADWSKAAHTFSEGIKGIFDGIIGFIEETDWEQAGDKFAEFFTELDYAGIASKIAEGIGGAIGGIGAFLRGIFRKLAEKGTAWGEHLFDECQDEIEAAGGSIGDAVWIGVKHVFTNSWKKAKEYIFQPFIKGFKKAFGIASPSKEMKPYGEYVGEGIFEGIKGIFSAPANWIRTNIAEPFKRGFSTAFNVVGSTATALKEKGETIANGIKSGISTGWNSITTMLDQKKSDLTTTGANFASSIGGGISGAWSTVTTAVRNGLDSLGNIDTGKLTSAGASLVAGLKDGITGGGWDSMVGRIWERYDDLKRWFDQDGRAGFRQSGEYMVDGLNEGLREKFSITLETVHNGGQAAVDAFNRAVGISSPSKAMAESGRYMMDGLTLGIQQESSRTYNAIRSVAAGIVDEVSGTELKPEMDMTAGGLDRVADKLAGIAQIFQTINSAFADFTRVPLPAIVTGAYAPAGTRVTDINGTGLTEIRQMLGRFLDRAAELEEKIDSRPVRVDVHAEIDKREIARATAEVRQDNSNINNGGGGRW